MAAKSKAKSRGPGRLSAEDTARMEERLLDAAESVFLDQGYARATIDGIAKAAGATRKTIYARYTNKEEIFEAVVRRLIDAGIAAPSLDPGMQNTDAYTRTLKLANDLVAFVDAPRVARVTRLVLSEGHQTPELIPLLNELYEREIASVSSVLTALKASGELPGLPEPRIAAVMFMEIVCSTARIRAVLGERAALPKKQVDAYTKNAVDLFLAGCGYTPR